MSEQPPGPEEQGEQTGNYPTQPPPSPAPYPYQPYPYPPVPPNRSTLAMSLGGFFTGVGWVVVVPGFLLAVLANLASSDSAGVLLVVALILVLAVPVGLLIPSATRRFGAFMLMGMAVTVIVLAGLCVAFIALISAGSGG